MFKTIDVALDELMQTRRKNNSKSSVEKMLACFGELGHPETNLQVIHVAGTNGKGSTVNYIRSILQEAEYTVGTFTSPHLIMHNDRIRVNDVPIDNDKLLSLINETYNLWEKYDLHMFEIDLLLAVLYFNRLELDFVVIETGIGGRLDATNVLMPIISVITNVGMDHMNLLGDTLEQIAFEKAGIIKNKTPIVTAEKRENVLAVFSEKAAKEQAKLILTKTVSELEVVAETVQFTYENEHFVLNTRALYQVENATLAAEVCYQMSQLGYPISVEQIKRGLAQTMWAGRFQEMLPHVFIDGAHNVAAIQALLATIKVLPKPIQIIFAALRDKQTSEMLMLLKQEVADITVTEFDFYRVAKAKDLASDQFSVEADYQQAIEIAMSKLENQGGSLVITGSLYFISEVYQYLKTKKEENQ